MRTRKSAGEGEKEARKRAGTELQLVGMDGRNRDLVGEGGTSMQRV